MSGLSKTERQRAKIKRLEQHLETWRQWAIGLTDAEPDTTGPALRAGISAVWEATREAMDGPVINVNGTIISEGPDE